MPLGTTAWIVVALKAFSAPQYLWGAAAMLVGYLWYLWVTDIIRFNEQEVNIFKDAEDKLQREVLPKVSK